MKRLGMVLLSILAIALPMNVSAKSYSFGGYYCDAKEDQHDGTFKEVCHVLVTSDFDINHIKLELILKNLVLDSVKTSSDWVNKNGLSNKMEFTSNTSHNGSFSVADLVFLGNINDEECEASIMPVLAEKTTNDMVCAIIDEKFYGKNGSVVDEVTYYEECCNYICTVVDNKYYFDNKGKSVDYDTFMERCSEIEEGPQTGIDYGYIVLPLGIISIIGILRFAKKNTKIYKI